MVQLKAIDVAIGIAFLYLLITFGASAIVEFISTTLNWRAHMLHDAIENMLENSRFVAVRDIYNNPQVLALCRNNAAHSWVDLTERYGWRSNGRTAPSYIPAATFSGAVLECLMNRALQSRGEPLDLSPLSVVKLISNLLTAQTLAPCPCTVPGPQDDALRSILMTTLATQGASIQGVRFALEKWFNDTMDRVSGWYKRRTQACLLMIGLLVAFGGNVSTIAVVRWLWQGDAARQAAIAAASEFIKEHPQTQTAAITKDNKEPPGPGVDIAMKIVDADAQVSALHYPIGWQGSKLTVYWVLIYVFGALITALAISMGSTFWFDAIQSLINIRGAGPKPSTR